MSDNRLRRIVPVFIIALFSFSVSSIYAYFTDTAVIPIKADSAEVSISVDLSDNETLAERLINIFGSRKYVFPGDILEKQAAVVSSGIDCYIRVKIETNLTEITDIYQCCDIDRTNWKLSGDHLYLTHPLTGQDNRATVFSRIHIPESIGNEYGGDSFYLRLSAEAVQARGISPDFTAPDPWGDTQTDTGIIRESGYL